MLEFDVRVLILPTVTLSLAQRKCIMIYTELSFRMPIVTQFAVS